MFAVVQTRHPKWRPISDDLSQPLLPGNAAANQWRPNRLYGPKARMNGLLFLAAINRAASSQFGVFFPREQTGDEQVKSDGQGFKNSDERRQ